MNYIELLLYLTSNCLIYYVYCLFLRMILGKAKVDRRIESCCYLAAFGLNSVVSLCLNMPMANLLTSVGALIALSFLYGRAVPLKLMTAVLAYGLILALDTIAYGLVRHAGAEINRMAICIPIEAILFLLLVTAADKLWKRDEWHPVAWWHWLAISGFPLGGVFTIVVCSRGNLRPTDTILSL